MRFWMDLVNRLADTSAAEPRAASQSVEEALAEVQRATALYVCQEGIGTLKTAYVVP